MIGENKIEPEEVRWRSTPPQQMAASCTGALITSIFMTPLDVVKIRLQSQQKAQLSNKCVLFCNGLMDHICPCTFSGKYTPVRAQAPVQFNGTYDAFIKIMRTEGIGTLWSGLAPTLILAIPATVVYFVLYEQIKIRLMDRYAETHIVETISYHPQPPFWIPLLSGSTARIISATSVSPLELIRTKMQSQKMSYFELGRVLKQLIEIYGILGLWKGLLPTLLRDVPFSAVYWTNYETIKHLWGTGRNSPMFYFLAGAASGSIAAVFTVPFDVVKTHQQIELGEKQIYSPEPQPSSNTISIIKSIYERKGIRGLFTGLTPRLVKVAPACAIMIGSFEYGKAFFASHNKEKFLLNKNHSDFNLPIKSQMTQPSN